MLFNLAGILCWLSWLALYAGYALGGHAGYDYKLDMLGKLGG
jgi:hypothetical protein